MSAPQTSVPILILHTYIHAYIHTYTHIFFTSTERWELGVRSGFIHCTSNPCLWSAIICSHSGDRALIMATGVGKLITEHCKIEINTSVSF